MKKSNKEVSKDAKEKIVGPGTVPDSITFKRLKGDPVSNRDYLVYTGEVYPEKERWFVCFYDEDREWLSEAGIKVKGITDIYELP